jgi:hypothetical protein
MRSLRPHELGLMRALSSQGWVMLALWFAAGTAFAALVVWIIR